MTHDLLKYLLEALTSEYRQCPIHPEITMKREIFDEDLFMYEYYCKECNVLYSPRVLDQMEMNNNG